MNKIKKGRGECIRNIVAISYAGFARHRYLVIGSRSLSSVKLKMVLFGRKCK